jgi:competence protein ComEA
MKPQHPRRAEKCRRTPLISIVAIIFVIFNLFCLSACGSGQAILITLIDSSAKGIIEYVYVGGSVNNPGFYPLKNTDNIETLVKAAGGIESGKECRQLQLIINSEEDSAQKININRAAAWLLEALPGIGNTRANAIIRYRIETADLKTSANSKGGSIAGYYDKIRELITWVIKSISITFK